MDYDKVLKKRVEVQRGRTDKCQLRGRLVVRGALRGRAFAITFCMAALSTRQRQETYDTVTSGSVVLLPL